MLPRSDSDDTPLFRTDFSNDEEWNALCTSIKQPVGEFQFRANIECVSDKRYDGWTVEQFIGYLGRQPGRSFVFVADRAALTSPEHAILALDLWDAPGRTFRVIPSAVWAVENNLSIANMDFYEFADSVDCDGVFRAVWQD